MSEMPLELKINARLRVVPDKPVPGVPFIDLTPVVADAALFHDIIEAMSDFFSDASVEAVVGIESRGYWFAPAIAMRLRTSFIPARKPDKLPCATRTHKGRILDQGGVAGAGSSAIGQRVATYRKDYEFELPTGVFRPGISVLIVDDLLAKGGSALTCSELVEMQGGKVVGCAFVVELASLGGRDIIAPRLVKALLSYP